MAQKALTNSIEQVKAVLPRLLASLNEESLLPDLVTTEQEHIVPILGQAFYDTLLGKYLADPPTLSDKEAVLVGKIRVAATCFGYHNELIIGHLTLSDAGLRKTTTTEMPAVVGWEYKDLKESLLTKAHNGVEGVIAYLLQEQDTFTAWKESPEYAFLKTLFIKSGSEFSKQYTLTHPNRTFYTLRSVIADVQDLYVKEAIGEELFSYLAAATDPQVLEIRAITYLKKAIALLTVKHAINRFTVRFDAAGFTVVNYAGDTTTVDGAGRTQANADQLEKKKYALDEEGQDFLSRARYQLYTHRQSGSSSTAFNTAYDAGVMASYSNDRSSGNSGRKIFTM